MASWRVNAGLLPEGQPLVGGIDDQGKWVATPSGSGEQLPGRFVLPGLVDAHCHLSIARGSDGRPHPLGLDEARANLAAARQAGILVIRDLGSPGSITLKLIEGEDGAGVLACGRFLAPQHQYFPALFAPVAPADLIEAARAEIAAGAQWVKLIGDFPVVGQNALRPSDAVQTYSAEDVCRLVHAVHQAGARVAAHTTTAFASELIAAGVDSIEHGDGLSENDLAVLAAQGGAWTPTLCASVLPSPGEDPERRKRRLHKRERLRHLLTVAVERGLTILAGTDVTGSVVDEVRLLIDLGLSPQTALAAASTEAHRYLGVAGFQIGQRVNLVSYHHDPRDDPEVLASPAAVIVEGQRIR